MAEAKDQFASIWSDAKARYAEITKRDLDDPLMPHPQTPFELEQLLEQQNSNFKHFREKKDVVFRSLKNICAPIQNLGSIVAQDASNFFPPTGMCFSSVAYFINAANGVSEAYDAIQELMETLASFLTRMNIYNRETISPELRVTLSQILALLLEVFARSTKIIDGGLGSRFKHYAKNFFTGRDDKIQSLVARIDKVTEEEARLIGAEVYVDVKVHGRKMDGLATVSGDTNTVVHQMYVGQEDFQKEMRKNFAQLNENTTQNKKDAAAKHTRIAKDLLSPSSTYSDRYKSICSSRVPDTGNWVYNESYFESWLERSIAILYISGQPGAGKSYLSGNIITRLREIYPQEVSHPSRTSVGYFFFQDNDDATRSFTRALKDMAYQITLNDSVYASNLETQNMKESDINTLRSTWDRLFADFYIESEKNDGKVFLVFDGVDEAIRSEREEFFQLIKDVQDKVSNSPGTESRIQILMVGRPEVEEVISEAIETPVSTIFVEERKNSADVERYIRTSLGRIKNLSGQSHQGLREEIVNTLASNAQGMFIWVDLMMRELSKKSRPNAVREALKHVPKGLTGVIKHVLEGFSGSLEDEQDATDLNNMLSWVCCAYRPLSLQELNTLLKINFSDEDGIFYLEGKLRKLYASFFVLTRDDGLSTADLQHQTSADIDQNESDTEERIREKNEPGYWDVDNETKFDSNQTTTKVALCHASIGDFLRDPDQGKVLVSGEDNYAVGVDIVGSQALVLDTCLRLICDQEYASNLSEVECLRTYAKQGWPSHLDDLLQYQDKIEEGARKSITLKLIRVLRDEEIIVNWIKVKTTAFFRMAQVESLEKWFSHKNVLSYLEPDDQEFVKTALSDPIQFWKPLTLCMTRRWLQSDEQLYDEDLDSCIVLVLMMEKKEDFEIQIPVAIESIHTSAEWPAFEKTALWYRRLGIVLNRSAYRVEACEEYEKALKLDPDMYQCRLNLMLATKDDGNHEKSISIAKQVIEYLESHVASIGEEEVNKDSAISYWALAANYWALNKLELAVDNYRKSFSKDPNDYSLIYDQVAIFYSTGKDFNRIVELLKSLDEMEVGEDTRLIQCINTYRWADLQFFQQIAPSTVNVGELTWLQEVYKRAVLRARQRKEVILTMILQVCLSQLYGVYSTEEDKAAVIWGRVIKNAIVTERNASWEVSVCKSIVQPNYIQYHYYHALEDGLKSTKAEKHIKELERLCQIKEMRNEEMDTITSNEAAIWLGLWYRLHGNPERAKPYFQPYIKEALLMLVDDDLSNDNTAFYKLSHALIAAGDEKSAISMLQAVRPIKRETAPAETETKVAKEENGAEAEAEDDAKEIDAKDDNSNVEASEVLSAVDNASNSANGKDSEGIEGMSEVSQPTVVEEDDAHSGAWVKVEAEPENGTLAESDSAAAKGEYHASNEVAEDKEAVPEPEAEPKSPEDLAREAYVSAMEEKYPESEWFYPWSCDGPCRKFKVVWGYGHICRLCLKEFCEPCLRLLKKGDMDGLRVCSPHHEWLEIPAIDRDDVVPGTTLIEGEVVRLNDYVAKLKKEWDVKM